MSVNGPDFSPVDAGLGFLPPAGDLPGRSEQKIFIIAGDDRDMTRAAERTLRLFVARSGGPIGRVVIVPATAPDPLDCGRRYARRLTGLGAGLVQVLHIANRDQANDENAKALLVQATGVLLAGSNQADLAQLLDGTGVLRTMHARHRAGCAVATTRAGALLLARQSDVPFGVAAIEI